MTMTTLPLPVILAPEEPPATRWIIAHSFVQYSAEGRYDSEECANVLRALGMNGNVSDVYVALTAHRRRSRPGHPNPCDSCQRAYDEAIERLAQVRP